MLKTLVLPLDMRLAMCYIAIAYVSASMAVQRHAPLLSHHYSCTGPLHPYRGSCPMSKLAIDEIATLANVSQATVSRVLNDHPSVRPETRARVLSIIDASGYVPSAAARSLASKRTHVLGLLIPGHTSALFSHAYFASIIPAIARCASERGFLLTLSTIGDPDEERRFYRQVLKATSWTASSCSRPTWTSLWYRPLCATAFLSSCLAVTPI